MIKQLKPVSTALDIMQVDSTTLADACHLLCNLLKDDNLKFHFKKFKKRFEKAVLPYHFLSNFLHLNIRVSTLVWNKRKESQRMTTKNKSIIPIIHPELGIARKAISVYIVFRRNS